MSDAKILELLNQMNGAPALREWSRSYHVIDGYVLVFERVGMRDRWSLSPSTGIVRLVDGMVPAGSARWFTTSALKFVYRASRMDFLAHARAMGARTL